MSDWPRTWKGVDRLLRKSETTVVFPSCFRCGGAIAREDLVEAFTIILATGRNAHRHAILLNCPSCGQDVACIDPLGKREEEFAYAPTH